MLFRVKNLFFICALFFLLISSDTFAMSMDVSAMGEKVGV